MIHIELKNRQHSYYKGISSIALLKEVGKILQENGYMIENIDSTVIAQRPKLLPYRPQMAENIAAALGIEKEHASQIRNSSQRKRYPLKQIIGNWILRKVQWRRIRKC